MSSVVILAERTDLTVKRSREVGSRVPDTFTPRGGRTPDKGFSPSLSDIDIERMTPWLLRPHDHRSGLVTLANALVVLSSTAKDGEIEVRISIGKRFVNQINPCRDRGLNPGPLAQKSDTLPPRSQGAFLVPYSIMLVVGGIPLFYMELALGQFNRKGAITCWGRLVPLFKGIGYAVALIAFYVDFYYNVIIAWALRYFFASFTNNLPWTTCDNSWNTPHCKELRIIAWDTEDAERDNSSVIIEPYTLDATATATSYHHDAANLSDTPFNSSKYTSAASEYFNRAILELNQSSGLHDLGAVKWDIALCLLAVYIICYFSLWKGISTSGKVVWFTALFPYAVLLILLVRGVTLPGSAEGIRYYLSPNFDAITKAEVWVDAATQVFFSLGPGFGVLLAYASYNKYHNNVYKDALVTSVINSCTSFIAGFVIFSVLGYMAHASGRHIKDVATEGPGLVFIVYPAAIATMPGSIFWALIFFMMLLTLGLDSSFGGSEAIITALSDEFPIIGHNREIFVACLFTLYFLVGLASCSQGGFYFFHLLDRYAAGYSMLFAVLFETIAVSWIYGTQRFCDDIHDMIGFSPGIYWRVCWKFLAPAFLMFIIVYGLLGYEPLTYDEYVYPLWANLLGWFIAGSSVAMIPGMAIFKMATTPGTFMQTSGAQLVACTP
uniref:Sodium-dependent dopamine transporter n=1 Tax=Timema genevievae TaxID=629358 RepID=A0A7R9JYA4_TIMGE|nr:unnamed protein product [Timema genevievae]